MARILPIDYPGVDAIAAQIVREGKLIVLPTDTVYGVGSQIEERAIARVFAAKRRALEKAIPVLLADIDAVEQVASDFPPQMRRLAEAFWPGPLTLVLPGHDDLPPNLTAYATVGVRVPDEDGTRAILAASGGALAVTSANRSDEPPACTIQAAIRYLSDHVALYIDGGACRGGVPSTVVTFEQGELRVLREGPIGEDVLRQVIDG